MTWRTRPKVSRREVVATKAFYAGETDPAFYKKPTKRGPQKETKVNHAGQEWASLRGGELYRNRRGLAQYVPPHTPIGVGPNGTGDVLGPFSIVITPAMVGKRIAVYAEFESKTEDGVVAPHQAARIEHLRDIGALCGVATNVEEFEANYQRWMQRMCADER